MTGTGDRRSGEPEDRDNRHGLTVWMARHEWSIVGAIAFGAFVLGCIGFYDVMDIGREGSTNSWWDPVYASMQLFIFEASDSTGGWPLHLQIARAVAPLVLLYTAAVAIFKQVETEFTLYRLHFRSRRFVVVCGIGEVGYRVARDYCLNTDKMVVVVDREPDNPLVAILSRLGAVTVHGNALDPVTLLKCRAMYAKEIFFCTDDDQTNISGAKTVARLSRRITDSELERLARVAAAHEPSIGGEPASTGLRAFLCVDDPDLYELFSNHPFFSEQSDRFSPHLFNRSESIARRVFNLCAPDMYYLPRDAEAPPMRILFIGFSAVVRELILQTALTAHYPDGRNAQVTVLCKDEMRDLVRRFFYRYPNLERILEFQFIYEDALTVTRESWARLQGENRFAVTYVAGQDDVEGVLTARRLVRLSRLLEQTQTNFVVCLNQQNFLAEIIDDDFTPIQADKSLLPAHAPIEYLETLDETISIDVIVNEALDNIARCIHNQYLESLISSGETRVSNASVVPWSELPPHKRKANQHAAAHMPVKLRCSGCKAVPRDAEEQAVVFPLDSDSLEVLSQLEHRRWLADKYLAGYSYGPVRDEEQMLHPDLIPWDELVESDREKDRNNVRQMSELLGMLDQKIVRERAGP